MQVLEAGINAAKTGTRVQVDAKVSYEDGRTGTVRADVAIRDVEVSAT